MPLTPFHIGPGLLIGEVFENKVNLISILFASILIDIRVIYCFFIGCTGRFHGPMHTFIGATVIALFIAIMVWSLKKPFKKITDIFKIQNSYSSSSIILGSFIGTWLHIILDSFMHSDIIPFWPIKSNFLLGMISNGTNYLLCTIALIIGLIIVTYRHLRKVNYKVQPK
ncbi:MAG TPA: hypothetical protein C5S51_03545 [Methanosarcinaceae archaeon]|nr:hypothetical protein [Methanosarcinaceae archaeon]